MKFAIFGLSVSSAWGNGHATLWRGLLRALAAAGHDVEFFERDTPYYAQHRDHPRGDGYDIVIYSSWAEVLGNARRSLDGADVAIVTSYCADARAACDEVLDAHHATRIFYDLDTPVTMGALERGESVFYVPEYGLGDFDCVLSFTGGTALDALRDRLSAKRVAPLYGCVDLSTHHPTAPVEHYTCDLSYLGTYARDRQARVESLFLDVARARRGMRFLLGGAMYPADVEWPSNVSVLTHVPPPEHPPFFASSSLTLNVTRADMARMGHCPSARLFEAAACGTPLVSDRWDGLESFFELDRELLVADDTEDVLKALDLGPERLATLAKRARERVLSEHEAGSRARELVDIVCA